MDSTFHNYENSYLAGLILPPSEMTCLKENLKLLKSIKQDELKFCDLCLKSNMNTNEEFTDKSLLQV